MTSSSRWPFSFLRSEGDEILNPAGLMYKGPCKSELALEWWEADMFLAVEEREFRNAKASRRGDNGEESGARKRHAGGTQMLVAD